MHTLSSCLICQALRFARLVRALCKQREAMQLRGTNCNSKASASGVCFGGTCRDGYCLP